MEHQFKKCPFCGSEVEIWSEKDKKSYAETESEFNANAFHFACSKAECLANDLFATNWYNEEEAAIAWNRRAGEGAQEE